MTVKEINTLLDGVKSSFSIASQSKLSSNKFVIDCINQDSKELTILEISSIDLSKQNLYFKALIVK